MKFHQLRWGGAGAGAALLLADKPLRCIVGSGPVAGLAGLSEDPLGGEREPSKRAVTNPTPMAPANMDQGCSFTMWLKFKVSLTDCTVSCTVSLTDSTVSLTASTVPVTASVVSCTVSLTCCSKVSSLSWRELRVSSICWHITSDSLSMPHSPSLIG